MVTFSFLLPLPVARIRHENNTKKTFILTQGFQTGHEGKADKEKCETYKTCHLGLDQLVSIHDLVESDVQQGA